MKDKKNVESNIHFKFGANKVPTLVYQFSKVSMKLKYSPNYLLESSQMLIRIVSKPDRYIGD